MIVVTAVGIAGGVIHQYLPLHQLLFYALGSLLRLLGDILLAILWIVVAFIVGGLLIGVTLGLPISFFAWMFTTTGASLWSFVSTYVLGPVVILFGAIILVLVGFPWIAPILFPFSWICGWLVEIANYKLRKVSLDRIITDQEFFLPSEGIERVYIAIASWLGMFLLTLFQARVSESPGIALFVFGTLLGVMIWGCVRGMYRIVSGKANGSFEDYINAPKSNR